jgi:type VI protein secretion system component VasK
MFILRFLPDFVFYLILLAGLAGIAASFVFKFIPFVSQYRLPIQWAAGIMTAFGLYMVGAISDNHAWEARVADLKLQVAKAEAASAEANGKVQQQLAAKDREIVAAQAVLKNRIKDGAVAMDAVCKIPSNAVDILNDAAKKGAQK